MAQATIQDVARQAGVSVSTVSRSFTRPNLVSDRTRKKVLETAQKLDFRISRSAAALKSGRSSRVALLLPSPVTVWFNAGVYAGLNSVLQQANYDICVFSIGTWEARRRFFSSMPVRRNADAVVLCSFNTVADELTELHDMNVPVIGINTTSISGLNADISLDDRLSERIAVEHLIGLGHRRLAYIYTSHDTPFKYSADDRQLGFTDAIDEAHARGLDVTGRTIACPYDRDPVNAALTNLLAMNPQPTALAFQTDDLAIPVMLRLPRYGKHVPQDYSIVGFDNSTYAADAQLTTMAQDPVALGRRAAQITLRLIDAGLSPSNRPLPAKDTFVTPTAQLLLRESTAPLIAQP